MNRWSIKHGKLLQIKVNNSALSRNERYGLLTSLLIYWLISVFTVHRVRKIKMYYNWPTKFDQPSLKCVIPYNVEQIFHELVNKIGQRKTKSKQTDISITVTQWKNKLVHLSRQLAMGHISVRFLIGVCAQALRRPLPRDLTWPT